MKLANLQEYCETLKSKFALPGTVSPEDQLKPVVAELFKIAGASSKLEVDTLTEAHLPEIGARPDLAIYKGSLICGYVELKAPGLGADAPNLPGHHNNTQWEKLKGLPNLIYTDGQEWALYRDGKRPDGHPIIRFRDDPLTKGKAAVTKDDSDALNRLFLDFLGWKPSVPHKPEALAEYLAPLTHFLRSEVLSALDASGSAVGKLANEWRQFFFPNAEDSQFADAYAQTVTYAMFLARLSGAKDLEPGEAAKTLDKNNGLLARTLELLGHKDALNELRVGYDLLRRSLLALDPAVFLRSKPDLWLYFYEDFLAKYDPELRKDYGVYYTPRQVVELQVRLADELLEKRFKKTLGFADDGVVFLDPAVGTGTYPVAAVKHGLEKVGKRSGPGAIPSRARQMARNMYGFEILVGPYAVAHLRLRQALEGAMNTASAVGAKKEKLTDRLKIYLADTLESPFDSPPGGLSLTHDPFTKEHEEARKVKEAGEVLVCLGNPPYDRQTIEMGDEQTQRKGGWVRFGNQIKGGAKPEEQGDSPIFVDFTEPGSRAGVGLHLKNLYNDYVYFWRWALWRLFERQECGGIISFITASSYLTGPGFVGVRQAMRKNFDDLWIIDLGGDNLGTRKTPNVFNIQTPVAIAIGVCSEQPSQESPAKTRYAKIDASTREDKLKKLDSISAFSSLAWRECPDDWQAPLVPIKKGDFFHWPALIDLFPYQRSGSKFGRTWPIGETQELLQRRWEIMLAETGKSRARYFKNNNCRKIEQQYKDHMTGKPLPTLESIKSGASAPKISSYAYRSYDRRYAMEDIRFNDRMGEVLWRIQSDRQIYLTTMTTRAFGYGQAMIASAYVPDFDSFRGSFGGKGVIPLYLDAEGAKPNVTNNLLEVLGTEYGFKPSAEDFAGYVYALLGGQSYTKRFWDELETPGPRIPLTKCGKLFSEVANLGRRLIWYHTYAERLQNDGKGHKVPSGTAKLIKGVSDMPSLYPAEYEYLEDVFEIIVGEGRFGPVTPEIWNFEVSGLKIVQSWLGYRMKNRRGRKSSPLDDIRPERWTPRMSDELLELLWVLEATIAMEPALEEILEKVVDSSCFSVSDLPQPSEKERKQPNTASDAGGLLGIMDDDGSD